MVYVIVQYSTVQFPQYITVPEGYEDTQTTQELDKTTQQTLEGDGGGGAFKLYHTEATSVNQKKVVRPGRVRRRKRARQSCRKWRTWEYYSHNPPPLASVFFENSFRDCRRRTKSLTILWLQQTVRSSCLSLMFNEIRPERINKRFNSAYLQVKYLICRKIHRNTF